MEKNDIYPQVLPHTAEKSNTAAPPWRFRVPAADAQDARDAVFRQMRAEGLLGCAMSAHACPSLRQWRAITRPERAWLLLCERIDAPELLGAALLTPWRGAVWEFDFTCFRRGMPWAVPMAREALAWIFAHAPVEALMGLCPRPNAHAWRLAERAGFSVIGVLPGACWWARRGRFVDGVVVLARKFVGQAGEKMFTNGV